jgi:hypothetical protein
MGDRERVKVKDLEYFIGHWRAGVENPATGQRFTLTYDVEPALSGVWLQGSGHAPELNLWVRDLWGHDASTGQIVRVVFDNQGVHGVVRSAGWNGDVLVLQGEAHTASGVVTVRETITRIDETAFRAMWEMRSGEEWVAYSVEELTRAGA